MPKPTDAALRKAARLMSAKGNRARTDKLSPERRQEIARKAAQVRWSKGRMIRINGLACSEAIA